MFDPNFRRAARIAIGLTAIAALAMPAATQQQQQVFPPIVRYTIDAGTMSGMAGMGRGGGMGAAMAMLGGGNSAAMREMILRIGSTRAPTGAPTAEHFMPAGAGLGKSVQLLTPTPRPGTTEIPEGTIPKGRLLIYWGCGPTAPKNQPIIIDFAKVAKGQVPPGLYAQPMNLPGDWDIKVTNSKTYADWPNSKDGKAAKPGTSIQGAHRIASNYAPEIAFTLNQDYMPALNARSSAQPSGSILINWNRLPTATGYYAWAFSAKGDAGGGGRGGGQPTEMVWWASSATQAFGGPLWDWLSPAAVQKLIAAKTVMPPSQTSCEIPAEVKKSGGEMTMGSLYAYGPELHFANPPRPADVKIPWKPDWTTRVRFRSYTMFMAGMPGMEEMGGREDAEGGEGAPPPARTKPKCRGLGGIAQRAAGLCE